MFYIDNFKRNKRASIMVSHLIPAMVIFIAFASLTVWSWQVAKQRAYDDQQQAQAKNIDDVSGAITNRVNAYEEILRAGASVFSASESVTRGEWSKFAAIFDLSTRYPGIQGVGYAKVVTPATRDAFIATVRATDYPDYKIYPDSNQPIQASLLYLAPSASQYSPSIGYDIYSDPARREAMNTARDTANSALTKKTAFLGEDAEKSENASFIMYFPIYSGGTPPADVAGRQAQLSGFVYAPLRASVLFNSLDNTEPNSAYGYRLFAGDTTDNNLLYQSKAFETIQKQNPSQATQTVKLQFGNTTWNLQFNSGSNLGSKELRKRPANALWGGLVFSFLIASLIYVLLASRARKLAYADEAEIQEAKDELLALASHQLRTPATGVKQYIGMLREGFVGKLTKNQKDILDKAYESNERQLMTISEMLSVARADSGRLLLEKTRLDIGKLLRDIVAEQRKAFDQQSQTVSLVLPKKPLYYEADPQYFRMAIENILNNANKYTPPGGTVNVRLKRAKENIQIHIEDTGVGVEERDFPLLFKKFSRIPNELTNKVSGSGIGLYLAKSIIKAHDGYIDFTSKPGEGSQFVIRLPLAMKKPRPQRKK